MHIPNPSALKIKKNQADERIIPRSCELAILVYGTDNNIKGLPGTSKKARADFKFAF